MKRFVKDMKAPSIFFEVTPKDTIDIFAIYVPEAKNPYLKEAFESYVTHNNFNPHYTASLNRIPDEYRIIGHSKCINHKQ